MRQRQTGRVRIGGDISTCSVSRIGLEDLLISSAAQSR